jgi:hypothetical protein
MATVPGIENDRLNLAHVWNTVWPDERLNGFGYVSPRHQRFSILFNHGEAQPTSSAVDDRFPAAADELQRTISGLFLYFRPQWDDLCGQFVKLGNIVHAQIIVAIYFDYLPLGSSNGDCGSEGQGSEGKRENRPTLHWEGHVALSYQKPRLSQGVTTSESRKFSELRRH